VGGPETVRVVGVHGRSPFVGVLARAIIRTNVTLNVTLPGDDVISFLQSGQLRGRHHNVTLLDPNRDSLRVTLGSINGCRGVDSTSRPGRTDRVTFHRRSRRARRPPGRRSIREQREGALHVLRITVASGGADAVRQGA